MTPHLINRVTILGTGLIGGSFALALRKHTPDIHITGWDRPDVVLDAKARGAIDEGFFTDLEPSIRHADLIYIALPIGATLDLLPEIAHHASSHALVTDACSTKSRIETAAAELFSNDPGPLFLGGHPMTGRELSGIAQASAELFQNATYALSPASSVSAGLQSGADVVAGLQTGSLSASEASAKSDPPSVPARASSNRDPRISAFVKILEKIGARPLWIPPQQHDYAVALASHLPQLIAIGLAGFLYDRLDENGLPITLAGPGLRDSLRLAGSPYNVWRDIVLTNREYLSAALDLYARRLDDLRERLASRELEADFDAANELYKLLRGL